MGPTNFTILDANVWSNTTFDNLKDDAAKALQVLVEQPEVDPNKITLIGHSEGAIIVPRVVMDLNNSMCLSIIFQDMDPSFEEGRK